MLLLFAVLESEQAIGDVLCTNQTTELTEFTSMIIQACFIFVCRKKKPKRDCQGAVETHSFLSPFNSVTSMHRLTQCNVAVAL